MTPALVCAGILYGLLAGKAWGTPVAQPISESELGTALYRRGFTAWLR
jgi:hypothetical protein